MDLGAAPNALAHCLWDYAIIAGGKREYGTIEVALRLTGVPVHQPAKTFIEPVYVERSRRRKGFGTAGAPECP